MKLSELFPNQNLIEDPEISGLSNNTQSLKPGDLFLCIHGANVDRHDYLNDAIAKGAVAALVDRNMECAIPLIKVENVNLAVDDVMERFYGYPDQHIHIIGITGTDGKTTTATVVQTLMGDDHCGYIGTNGISCKGYTADSDNTTPDKLHLLDAFRHFLDMGCEYVAMEASSEGFHYHRTDGLVFDIAAISNVTSEHLNTHKTLENYIACKQQLFLQNRGISVLNADDAHYGEFLKVAKNVMTYGRKEDNDLWIKDYTLYAHKTDLCFNYKGRDYNFSSPLVGHFNVENLAEAFLICLNCGMKMETLIERVPLLHIDGRMENVDMGQDFIVLVDYAHTPNGIQSLMDFVKELPHRHIIAVSGQAGGRDQGKRKYVGEAIARNVDHAIWTLEDPRNEKVEDIAEMMSENIRDLNNYETVNDRSKAIEKAVAMAQTGDIVLILGKGIEDYNIVGKEEISYPGDVKVAENALRELLKR